MIVAELFAIESVYALMQVVLMGKHCEYFHYLVKIVGARRLKETKKVHVNGEMKRREQKLARTLKGPDRTGALV